MNNPGKLTQPGLKDHNRSMILKLICTGEALTRSALAEKTRLSKMTVTNLVSELIEEDIIREVCADAASGRGRKPMTIRISPEAPLAVGIFISRDKCSVVLSDIEVRILKHVRIELHPGQALSNDILLQKFYDAYLSVVEGVADRVFGIGVASLGPVDRSCGVILNPPDFYGMSNIRIKSFFEEKTGLPVYFDNNMNAAVLAEKLFGHGKNLENLIYIGVLYGVGAGVFSGGRLLEGATGVIGEIGHTSIKYDGPLCLCGNRGCLELYTSLPVIVKKAERTMRENGVQVDFLDWPGLVELARKQDYYAIQALDELCEYLAVGIVNLVNMIDCGEIFLGHDIALAKGLIERRLEQRVNRCIFSSHLRAVRIRMSAFGEQAPLVGSVCLALNSIFNSYVRTR